jgi:hypothetical protein
MKRQFVVGVMIILFLFGSRAAAQGTAEEVTQLKKEVAKLRKDLEVLKKELARLKGGPVNPGKNFVTRLAAAELITTLAEREKAFVVLSVAAAKGGDAVVAQRALNQITTLNSREDCTFKIAILLGKAGQSETALAIARRLTTLSLREKAFAAIAKGEADD